MEKLTIGTKSGATINMIIVSGSLETKQNSVTGALMGAKWEEVEEEKKILHMHADDIEYLLLEPV